MRGLIVENLTAWGSFDEEEGCKWTTTPAWWGRNSLHNMWPRPMHIMKALLPAGMAQRKVGVQPVRLGADMSLDYDSGISSEVEKSQNYNKTMQHTTVTGYVVKKLCTDAQKHGTNKHETVLIAYKYFKPHVHCQIRLVCSRVYWITRTRAGANKVQIEGAACSVNVTDDAHNVSIEIVIFRLFVTTNVRWAQISGNCNSVPTDTDSPTVTHASSAHPQPCHTHIHDTHRETFVGLLKVARKRNTVWQNDHGSCLYTAPGRLVDHLAYCSSQRELLSHVVDLKIKTDV